MELELNSYRVTLYDDERLISPNVPTKVVFECVKYHSQEDARHYGTSMAEIIYGSQNGISVHVEFVKPGKKPKPVLEPLADPDRELLQAVRADEWFVMGGMRARIDTCTRDVEIAKKSVKDDDGSGVYTGLKSMIWEAERIIKEYSAAYDRLKAAGLRR